MKFYSIILIFIFVMLLTVGCTEEKKTETSDESEPKQTEQQTENEISESGVSNESDSVGESMSRNPAVGDSEVRTKEKPLMPPAPDAKGVESVPEGEVSLVVSVTGVGDAVPLEDSALILAADKIKVQISVVNTTSGSVSYSFSDGQKHDIACFDSETGDEIYRWSAGRRFAQVLDTKTVEPGEVWTHQLDVEMGDGENQLPYGEHNWIVSITGTPPLMVTSSNVTVKSVEE